MTLVRHDFAYYYSQAPFKTFMVGNVLFIIIDAPVTNNALKEVLSVYELTRLPLPTPETDRFYSLLSTEIKYMTEILKQ